ncbi:unnamed protein product [Dovyalis caffra]|uniref:Uncharacterized protein n=1 Tax=Dovyalis caffra TaxID=77055 RepID=A0AAV1R994_9ROSI|nr:unnamed protein product [Dovyalis caffra]
MHYFSPPSSSGPFLPAPEVALSYERNSYDILVADNFHLVMDACPNKDTFCKTMKLYQMEKVLRVARTASKHLQAKLNVGRQSSHTHIYVTELVEILKPIS